MLNWKTGLGIAAGCTVAGCAAPVIVPYAAGVLGFGVGGIKAGTTAAYLMSLYGGAVPAGGAVATLQSIGAAGIGLSGTAIATVTGGGMGAAIARMIRK